MRFADRTGSLASDEAGSASARIASGEHVSDSWSLTPYAACPSHFPQCDDICRQKYGRLEQFRANSFRSDFEYDPQQWLLLVKAI